MAPAALLKRRVAAAGAPCANTGSQMRASAHCLRLLLRADPRGGSRGLRLRLRPGLRDDARRLSHDGARLRAARASTPSSKACKAPEARRGSTGLKDAARQAPSGDEHPAAQEQLAAKGLLHERPLPGLVDEASCCHPAAHEDVALAPRADIGAEAGVRGRLESAGESAPEDQASDMVTKSDEPDSAHRSLEDIMAANAGRPRLEIAASIQASAGKPTDGDVGSPRWSRLASELGTGCRPFLCGDDAAAAAAAALLKRLGGAKAGGDGGLPAVAPFAEQLPSPLFCRPLPLFLRSRRVRFDEALNTTHEVTPYAEVYGRHPRHFVFDRRSRMIPAAHGGFVGLRASIGADEELEEDEEDEVADAAAELGSPVVAQKGLETSAPEVVPPAKEEHEQPPAVLVAKDGSVHYQDEDEECFFALPASLKEALEVTSHAPAETCFEPLPESIQVAGLEEKWEANLVAAVWSAYDHNTQSVKGDRAAGCLPIGVRSGLTDTTSLTSAFIFSPPLTSAR